MSRPAPFVIGNWKMHGTRAGAIQLAARVSGSAGSLAGRCRVALCPAYVHLDAVLQTVVGRGGVEVGGQDVAVADEGAWTGDVSAPMLRDLGCTLCIVGHSERRQHHRDTNDRVAEKFMALARNGLRPVLCVGETQAQREAGETDAVVRAQLEAVLDAAGIQAFTDAVVAYEPVWAIGTGLTASPEQAQEVHAKIRAVLSERDAAIARVTPLLYGGSVKPGNASALFSQLDVDGGLIGGASLVAADFLAICAAAADTATAHNEV